MRPSSAITASVTCAECGLQAWAAVEAIYAAENLIEQDGQTLARWAFYRCPANHVTRIPYTEAMSASASSLHDLLQKIVDAQLS